MGCIDSSQQILMARNVGEYPIIYASLIVPLMFRANQRVSTRIGMDSDF